MAENTQEEIEDKVIDCITMGAGGRLVVFKPENSDKDLIVEKKGDYKKKVISLNVYKKEQLPKISAAKEENFYLVFVNFDIIKQDIDDDILVIPPSGSRFSISKKDFGSFLISKLK